MAFPPSLPHGPIEEVFTDIFNVRGTAQFMRGLTITRNMIIVRNGKELSLINAVRLSEEGLAELLKLGDVKNVVRIGTFHLSDDPFYVKTFKAKMWALPKHEHRLGLVPDVIMSEDTQLPFPDAKLFVFATTPLDEGCIVIQKDGGVLITADSVQHFITTEGCSFLGALMMRSLGFVSPCNIGLGWNAYNQWPTDYADFNRLLKLNFSHLLSAHGEPLRHDAHTMLENTVKRWNDKGKLTGKKQPKRSKLPLILASGALVTVAVAYYMY